VHSSVVDSDVHFCCSARLTHVFFLWRVVGKGVWRAEISRMEKFGRERRARNCPGEGSTGSRATAKTYFLGCSGLEELVWWAAEAAAALEGHRVLGEVMVHAWTLAHGT
jgi:hypothetical protein